MDQNTPNPADADFDQPKLSRRRKLLPWWVIGFTWIFMIFAALMPFAIIFGILHFNFQMALLGLATDEPFSLMGVLIMALFLFKGIVAIGLWIEKRWAAGLAKIDAIISMIICIAVIGYALFIGHTLSLRLELIAIIPYYLKMNNIQYDWENFNNEDSPDPVAADAV